MHKNVFTFTPSTETQGRSVESGEKAGRKFSGTGKRAPGYRLSPNYAQQDATERTLRRRGCATD